ncbi:response regulator transcription factor [Stutzerimonas frequens]|uniref:response regulator transcription factor n=1 Tax=Stutzerimonas frequens TaxID=2968969 RepID=UPI000D7D63F8|nr:response regulator transcription factor [Stutzerimonas frequens]AWT10346.1 DNA-binding response regulator [Stutzerimonas frequens]MDL0440629.1 response regulator transcription factor [Stutzerimonas frequens]WCR44195.1 response regulator transcription factor [Stutzerimonas stutzeri]
MGSYLADVLVIEDDELLSIQLGELLRLQGYAVRLSGSGESGLAMALADAPDLVLLDVMLPDINGLAVLRRLREQQQTPVIMLTACGAEEERIRGLRHGADDYLSKPFNLTELQLRIDAILRRTRSTDNRPAQPSSLQIDALMLERQGLRARVAEKDLALTPLQFRLLWQLLLQRGEVLTKPYLYRVVLERDYSGYDRSLDMHISRIRRRLTEAGLAADRLQTLHGRGYSFQ